VYVATDSDEIKNVVRSLDLEKVIVIGRSEKSAEDIASTEYAMLEFANKHDLSHIVLIQAISPLLTDNDLNQAIELYMREDTDSVISVVRQKRFIWEVNDIGYANAVNYDYNDRPRRQNFDDYFVENGAFYITEKINY